MFPKAPFSSHLTSSLVRNLHNFSHTDHQRSHSAAFVHRARCTHQGCFITFIPPDSLGVSFLSSCISGIPYTQEQHVFSIPPHIRSSAHLLGLLPWFILLLCCGISGKNHSEGHYTPLTWAAHFLLWAPLPDHPHASLSFSLDQSTLRPSYYCNGAKGWILPSWLKRSPQNFVKNC